MLETNPEKNFITKNDKKDYIQDLTNLIIKNLGFSNPNAENFDQDITDLVEGLEEIEGLDDEIERMLAEHSLSELTVDDLKTKILKIIRKYLEKKGKDKSDIIKDKKIDFRIEYMSKVVLSEYFNKVNQVRNSGKSQHFKVDERTKANNNRLKKVAKQLIKNFATYEIYKVMNPRRIAGQTRLQNFISNVVKTKDVQYATKFTGGSKSEIKGYSAKVKDALKKQNVKNSHLLGR